MIAGDRWFSTCLWGRDSACLVHGYVRGPVTQPGMGQSVRTYVHVAASGGGAVPNSYSCWDWGRPAKRGPDFLETPLEATAWLLSGRASGTPRGCSPPQRDAERPQDGCLLDSEETGVKVCVVSRSLPAGLSVQTGWLTGGSCVPSRSPAGLRVPWHRPEEAGIRE